MDTKWIQFGYKFSDSSTRYEEDPFQEFLKIAARLTSEFLLAFSLEEVLVSVRQVSGTVSEEKSFSVRELAAFSAPIS